MKKIKMRAEIRKAVIRITMKGRLSPKGLKEFVKDLAHLSGCAPEDIKILSTKHTSKKPNEK